jgi:hypothetical protein
MPIVPDTKNWTWAIERVCPECGFDATTVTPADIAPAIRGNAATWLPVLVRTDVRVRPNDSTWSALEYGAHVRDVLRIYLERVHLMTTQDDPLYANWDQDATAIDQRYNEQDPAIVGAELSDAASALAAEFEGVNGADWQRTGRRSDGAGFTIDTISRYLLHDIVHHRWDVAG